MEEEMERLERKTVTGAVAQPHMAKPQQIPWTPQMHVRQAEIERRRKKNKMARKSRKNHR